MTALDFFARTPLAQAAGAAVFHSLWQGAIIGAVLGAILGVVRPARARYGAACLAMCALLGCFIATFALAAPHAPSPSAADNAVRSVWSGGLDEATLTATRVRGLAEFFPWLAPFWMAGVLIFYLRHLASWLAARRWSRTGVCRASDLWQQRLGALAERLGIQRPVALVESCLARVPVIVGHLRPVILMPVGLLTSLPVGQIESILLHELAHIVRYDYLANLVETSVESLLFYHPLVWWISRVIRAEREHCADDIAAALTENPQEYARALVALEENCWGASEAALAATGGDLMKRIRRLLVPTEQANSGIGAAFSACMLALAAIGLFVWQAKAQAPPEHAQQVSPYTRWLTEDVAYIITDRERLAFQALRTDDERQHFIEQFWLRRDPTPGTPENEFKEEHYRRIQYANDHFGSSVPGWKTDRGRIYILFGPPDERHEYRNGDGTMPYPLDRWKYRFIEGIGNDVFMEFVDSDRSGEYYMTMDPNRPPGGRVYRPQR